jgi:hypothetical protein
MTEVDEYHAYLILLYNLVWTRLANLEKIKPTRTCANLESKDILFVTFQQKKPSSQKAYHV